MNRRNWFVASVLAFFGVREPPPACQPMKWYLEPLDYSRPTRSRSSLKTVELLDGGPHPDTVTTKAP